MNYIVMKDLKFKNPAITERYNHIYLVPDFTKWQEFLQELILQHQMPKMQCQIAPVS
jgi:hypothetical protein